MSRTFTPIGIHITAGVAPCSYHCRYCQLDYRKSARFGTDRFIAVVDRFLAYREKSRQKNFKVAAWMGYSYDLPLKDFVNKLALYRRCDNNVNLILLGGVRHRPDAELRAWFSERKALNLQRVVASYYGYGDTHDYLNNKQGNFAYLIHAQQIAAQTGFRNSQRVFLFRSSLAQMEQLLDRLDEVGESVTERMAYPLFYSGLARRYEEERVTMEDLDRQPQRVRAIYRQDKDRWQSERQWIDQARTDGNTEEKNFVELRLTDQNIEQVETMSCEDILADLVVRTKAAYSVVPSRANLAERYGDSSSDKIYMFMWEMECLWLDRYLKKHPMSLERELTHFGR